MIYLLLEEENNLINSVITKLSSKMRDSSVVRLHRKVKQELEKLLGKEIAQTTLQCLIMDGLLYMMGTTTVLLKPYVLMIRM